MTDSLDDAFRSLGNEHRIQILRTLGEAGEALSFSELRSRTEIRDSGKFNYHLDELRDRYVEKTDEGYQLTRAGLRVTGAIVASAYSEGSVLGPEPTSTDCPVCGAERTAIYEDSAVRVQCTANDDHHWLSPLPPGATAGRDLDDLVQLGGVVNRHYGDLAAEGTCPQCFGEMTVEMRAAEELSESLGGHEYVYQATCEECGFPVGGGIGSLVTSHPAVVKAYYEHGVNVQERTHLPHEYAPPTVVSEDPLRLRVDVELPREDSDLVLVSLTVDDSANVVAVTEQPES
jgi:hypothetical protein